MGHRVYRPLHTQPFIHGDLIKTSKPVQKQQTNFAAELQSALKSDNEV